jgi:peptide/nickel transport system substrate-binding protein
MIEAGGVRRRSLLRGAAGAGLAGWVPTSAGAQDRAGTLISISDAGPNSLDFHTVGANRAVYSVVWNCYDRLISFAVKRDADGNGYYDYSQPTPELAEDLNLGPTSATLKLRRDATFHDGTPITAADVKYTFDRAVGVGGYSGSSMASASLTDAAQFVVVDDHTFRVDYADGNKLAPLYLGVPIVGVYHAALVKQHATPQDPWAQDFTRANLAGGGAFKVERNTPGQEIVLVRNADWRCGPKPTLDRVIWRVVPSAGTRRALLERGDADLSYDVAPKDASEMKGNPALRVYGVPMENTVTFFALNMRQKPFGDVRVRQAVAWAIPYQKIMDVALYGRGRALFGGPETVTTPDWPQPTHYVTDLARARQLLSEAGYPEGFESQIFLDLGSAETHEPIAVLVAESLAQIGIKTTIEKVPPSQWRSQFSAKTLPMQINLFGNWFNYSDFFFYFVYDSRNTIFNFASYADKEMDRLVGDARLTRDKQAYDQDAIGYIRKAYDDVPDIPLFQPYLDIAMRKNVSGYTYWFHRAVDYRGMLKA